jgi:2-oxoglutarate/2-oxoacid ferredoxin oxidoreductase subunit alpha
VPTPRTATPSTSCSSPPTPSECFEFAVKAFDLAERFQTPVFVLSDLDIGMNDWVVPRLTWDDSYEPDRGRILSKEEIQQLGQFFRYSPEDENFVAPPHSLRHLKPAKLTR